MKSDGSDVYLTPSSAAGDSCGRQQARDRHQDIPCGPVSSLASASIRVNQGPRRFTEELEALKSRLLAMGGLAEERLRLALQGLVDRNQAVLADVIAGDSRVDKLQMEIDDRCFTLLALYQPVAIDLRTIVS